MNFNDPEQVREFFDTAAAAYDCVVTKFDFKKRIIEFNGVDQEGLAQFIADNFPCDP